MSRSINRQCPLCGMRHPGPPDSYHLTEDDHEPAEPDAGEVEALVVLIEAREELREVYRVWSERRQNLSDLTRRLDENARQIADALTPALLDRVRREEGAKVLREAADDFNLGALSFKEGGWGSNPADQQAISVMATTLKWLRDRAASVGRGEGP